MQSKDGRVFAKIPLEILQYGIEQRPKPTVTHQDIRNCNPGTDEWDEKDDAMCDFIVVQAQHFGWQVIQQYHDQREIPVAPLNTPFGILIPPPDMEGPLWLITKLSVLAGIN